MRRLLLSAAIALGLSGPAAAGFVFFYQALGDWTVLCWRGVFETGRACTLSAPPASLAYRKAPNVLQVDEYAPDAFQVAITVRDQAQPGLPLVLRVDGFRPHETGVEGSLARWFGDEAREILVEMRAGKAMIYRVQTAPDGLPSDTRVSLATFPRALEIYRRVIRAHNMLKPAK